MLVLSRHVGERTKIVVGDIVIWVTVVENHRGKMRLGFEGPPEVKFWREEIADKVEKGGAT